MVMDLHAAQNDLQLRNSMHGIQKMVMCTQLLLLNTSYLSSMILMIADIRVVSFISHSITQGLRPLSEGSWYLKVCDVKKSAHAI